jgi:uncharacterized membrane protein
VVFTVFGLASSIGTLLTPLATQYGVYPVLIMRVLQVFLSEKTIRKNVYL